MEDIALYILKKYGYKLTLDELKKVIDWYDDNKSVIIDEENLDKEIRDFLHHEFPNKILYLCEEDTSNMSYLLTMLKNRK